MTLPKPTLQFLTKLKSNNNRDWFKENKHLYDKSHKDVSDFATELIKVLNKHDEIVETEGKKCLFRIYRDVRFSKDKTPYTTWWSGGFSRKGKLLRGGYYFRIQPGGKSVVACGFWGPNSNDLKRIREDISLNTEEWRKVLKRKALVNHYGEMRGEQVKTAPKGYAKDHDAIDLLRYKQFLFVKEFSDKEVLAPSFTKEADKAYKAIRPFFDHMSEVLTTNLNGEVIV